MLRNVLASKIIKRSMDNNDGDDRVKVVTEIVVEPDHDKIMLKHSTSKRDGLMFAPMYV